MKSLAVWIEVIVRFRTCDNAAFTSWSRRTSEASDGFHAVFSPGAHSISAPPPATDKRTPLAPPGTLNKRPDGRLGRKSFSPVQDIPPSTDLHTPFAEATVTSSGSRG